MTQMDIFHEIDETMKIVNKVRPFEGSYLKQINKFFKVKTTYSSNAIEGNPHTLEETKTVIENGVKIERYFQYQYKEIEGHGRAYDFMFSLINKKGLTEKDILTCHQLFGKDNRKFTNPGQYRKLDIVIKDSNKKLPKFEEVPQKMLEYISWINKERSKYHPVMFASEANRKFGNIHPFTEGNGRIARLIMNTCLYQDKYFPVAIPVLKRKEFFLLIEEDNGNNLGAYIGELELQTVKDLIRYLHIK
jgi:Fic family protein